MTSTTTRRSRSRRSSTRAVTLIAAAAAAAATLAPVRLTGDPRIDVVERALVVGGITFVGAHGRRWSWVIAGALIVAPARGAALVLGLFGLLVVVGAAVPRRRSKPFGATGLALLGNAVFWYPASAPPYAPVLAVAGLLLPLVVSTRYLRPTIRRWVRVALAGTAGLLVLVVVLAGGTMALAAGDVVGGTRSARLALRSARQGNADLAAERLGSAGSDFADAERLTEGPATFPALLVPGLAQQVRAVRGGVREGRRITSSATDLVATADYDALTYQGRIDLGQVERLQAPTERVATALRTAEHNLGDLRRGWLLPPLRTRLGQFSDAVSDARNDASLASDLLDITPSLLGGTGERRYLVVFITPAELRGAGGFIGSYAELSASAGRTELVRAGRIEELINAAAPGSRNLTGPADYLRRYGRNDPADLLQDATVSPDFPSVAQVLAELYPQSGGRPVDGVISVDPTGLAALLTLTGPVPVDGLDQPLDSDNAVEILTRSQYVDVPDRSERGEILTDAVRATFERLTEGSLPAPRRLADVLSPPTRGGHLRLWSPNRGVERVYRRLGADGALRLPQGDDGFSVVQQNVGNNKIDAYLRRSISYRVRVDTQTGRLTSTLEVVLRNEVPSIELPRAVVGNNRGQPPGTNVATLSIYTPHVVTASRIDGAAVQLGPDTELGLNVYDTPILSVAPGQSLRLELDLAGAVDLSKGYRLHILPQPVANPDRLDVTVSALGGRLDGGGPRAGRVVTDQPLLAPLTVQFGLVRND